MVVTARPEQRFVSVRVDTETCAKAGLLQSRASDAKKVIMSCPAHRGCMIVLESETTPPRVHEEHEGCQVKSRTGSTTSLEEVPGKLEKRCWTIKRIS